MSITLDLPQELEKNFHQKQPNLDCPYRNMLSVYYL